MIAVYFESDLVRTMLIMGGMFVVSLILLVAGAYVFVRLIAVYLNSKRDYWEATASKLGFEVDRTSPSILKPLQGEHQNYKVKIGSFRVPTGETSSENHISCEAFYAEPLKLLFEVQSQSALFSWVASWKDSDVQIGYESFDKTFWVASPDPAGIQKLLLSEMPGGRNPNLMTELIAVKKRRNEIKAASSSITVSSKCEMDDIETITKIMEDAVHLAGRFDVANRLHLVDNR